MGKFDDTVSTLPPKIKAAFEFLHHTRLITEQVDAAIPMRPLTSLERSVEAAALRALQQYLLGEMDFADSPAESTVPKPNEGDGAADSVTASK